MRYKGLRRRKETRWLPCIWLVCAISISLLGAGCDAGVSDQVTGSNLLSTPPDAMPTPMVDGTYAYPDTSTSYEPPSSPYPDGHVLPDQEPYDDAEPVQSPESPSPLPSPDYKVPPTPDYKVPPTPDYKVPPTPDYKVPPTPDYKVPPTPDYKVPDYKVPPTPDYKMSDYKMPDYKVPPTPDYKMSDYKMPDYKVPPVPEREPSSAEPVPDLKPDVKVPEPPADRLCCVCQYLNNNVCAAFAQEACDKNSHCAWHQRRCMPRHQRDCLNWSTAAAQRRDCHVIRINRFGQDPTAGLRNCTRFRYNYEGHGRGCTNLTNRVRVCVNRLPLCTRFDIEDTGCSTFSNLTNAQREMLRIQALLGGAQCVTVSANQCYAGNSCQNRYLFTITSKSCTGQAATCSQGGVCYRHKQVAQCRRNNRNTIQTCCCDNRNDRHCRWRVGTRSCRTPCNHGGACSPRGRIQLCHTARGTTSQICCCDRNGRNCKWRIRSRSCN